MPEIKTGQKCGACGKDNWRTHRGHLRCACGQACWIERYQDQGGVRFKYVQGRNCPTGYQGWERVTR